MSKFNIELHKVISNSEEFMESIPHSDRSATTEIELSETPISSALGLKWDLLKDDFVFSLILPERPFTKRGIVSVVNTLFDPLGIVSPIVLGGRLLQREIFQSEFEDEAKTVG